MGPRRFGFDWYATLTYANRYLMFGVDIFLFFVVFVWDGVSVEWCGSAHQSDFCFDVG
jgi:hypothetical protein